MRDVVTGRLSPRRNVAALAAIALAGSLAMGAKAPPAGGGAAAQVRVNLVGYAATGTKRAYLMSGAAETGATFAVKSGPTTVLSGPVGADLGSWSNSYSHVYAIDFDSLTTAGTYTIAVSGPAPATSPCRSRSGRPRPSTLQPLAQRAVVLPGPARRARLRPVRARGPPAPT